MENKGNLQRIVRCKDCKYWEKHQGDNSGICSASVFDGLPDVNTFDTFFCAVGEERISECDGSTHYESIPDDEIWNPYSKQEESL